MITQSKKDSHATSTISYLWRIAPAGIAAPRSLHIQHSAAASTAAANGDRTATNSDGIRCTSDLTTWPSDRFIRGKRAVTTAVMLL
jgi:hypothetical protein